MVRMLHSLVGDGPDAFTLIGDGGRHYPGGYVLSEAGISLAGRGVVLDRNYRNTAEIQEFAGRLIAGSTYTDIDGDASTPSVGQGPGGRACRETRPAPRPKRRTSRPAPTTTARWSPASAKRSHPTSVNLGDIAVLCGTNGEAAAIEKLLAAARIRSLNLLDYVGLPVDAVKVGTIKRAKGLEFKLCHRALADDDRAISLRCRARRPRHPGALRRRQRVLETRCGSGVVEKKRKDGLPCPGKCTLGRRPYAQGRCSCSVSRCASLSSALPKNS